MNTVTNLKTYVDGYEVITSDEHTLTLNNGVVIQKRFCKFICEDAVEGATYYRYTES